MPYYQHRISHHWEWSYPLLEHGNLLSIGFSACATEEFLNQLTADNWGNVAANVQDFYEQERKWRPREAYSLQRFLGMERGDTVIVPISGGMFHAYQVQSNRRLIPQNLPELNLTEEARTNWHGFMFEVVDGSLQDGMTPELIDLGFFREVMSIKRDISRADYADADLWRRMKAYQTTLDVTDLENRINAAIERARNEEPINLRRKILEGCAKKLAKKIAKKLNSDQFEMLIRDYFHQIGGTAEIPPKNQPDKKGDADVIATFEALKVIFYIQAKRHDWDSKTDDWAVKQVNDYVESEMEMLGDDGYTRIAWAVSSAREFSRKCESLARSEDVRLINGLQFAEMLLDAGVDSYELFS